MILDEAHTVESVASDHLGINVTSGQFEYLLNKLYNDRTNKGLLVHHGLAKEQQQVDRCRHWPTSCSAICCDWRNEFAKSDNRQPPAPPGVSSPLRVHDPAIVANHLSPELEVLAKQLKAAGKKLSEESEQQDFIAAHDRLMVLAGELETWRTQAQKGTVYWIESYEGRRGTPRLTLVRRAGRYRPRDARAALRQSAFGDHDERHAIGRQPLA